MDMVIYTSHSLRIITDTLATLLVEIVVLDVEIYMVLKVVEIDTILNCPVLDMMVTVITW